MKRRRVFVGVLAVLVLAAGLGWYFWPRHNNGPLLRLKVIRQSVEQGKPVVFFEVEAIGGRRRQICNLEREDYWGETIKTLPIQDVWKPLGLGDPFRGQKQFGVLEPTKAGAWKLRVTVATETERVHGIKTLWRLLRMRGTSLFAATKQSLEAFYPNRSEVIESDFITNSVPVR